MSNKLIYSKSEIYRIYKNAKYPEKQIVILAQLNCVPVTTIKEIIHEMEHPECKVNKEESNMISARCNNKRVVEHAHRSSIDSDDTLVSRSSARYNKSDIQQCIREGLSAKQTAEKLGYPYATKQDRNNFSTRFYTIRKHMKLVSMTEQSRSTVEEDSTTSVSIRAVAETTALENAVDKDRQSVEDKLNLVIKEISEIQSTITALKSTICKYESLVNKLISAFQQ